MSSPVFAVNLETDALAARLVAAAGAMTCISGLFLIASIDIPGVLRLLLGAVWAIDCGRGAWRIQQGARRVGGIRIDSTGRISAFSGRGEISDVALESGSMVLRQAAWLRLRFADGRRHAFLLLARRTDSRAWHRLQLLWRLRREIFGPDGAA